MPAAAAGCEGLYGAPARRRAMLDAFIRFLIDHGLLARSPPADDDQSLDELLLVSHCTVVAGRLGLDHGYVFNRLLSGPHSDRLDDELDAAAMRARAGLGGAAPPLPARFDADRFLRLLAGKDADWITAAAYLIIFSQSRPDIGRLVEWIGRLSEDYSTGYCRAIVEEMTSPEIGIVLDCDKYMRGEPWQAEMASATHYPAPARPIPAAAV